MSKHVATALALVAGLCVSGMSAGAQAGTTTTVIVKDGLTTDISPSSPNILGTITPSLQVIHPGSLTYTVRSPYNDIASIHFTYSSGSKSCRFDTSVTAINGIPSWTKAAKSTGSTYATCEAKITYVKMTSPFDYTVEFTMR